MRSDKVDLVAYQLNNVATIGTALYEHAVKVANYKKVTRSRHRRHQVDAEFDNYSGRLRVPMDDVHVLMSVAVKASIEMAHQLRYVHYRQWALDQGVNIVVKAVPDSRQFIDISDDEEEEEREEEKERRKEAEAKDKKRKSIEKEARQEVKKRREDNLVVKDDESTTNQPSAGRRRIEPSCWASSWTVRCCAASRSCATPVVVEAIESCGTWRRFSRRLSTVTMASTGSTSGAFDA